MKLTELKGKYKRLMLGTDTTSHGKAIAHFRLSSWIDILIGGGTLEPLTSLVEEAIGICLKDVRRKKKPLTGYERVSALEEIQVYAAFLVDLASIQY